MWNFMSKPSKDFKVAIIGTGFSGLTAAIKLIEAGITNFTIYEKAAAIGGVWRDNTYPGAGCDVPSHLYSLSFALKKDWSRVYSPQAEILEYMKDIVKKYKLEPYIRFNSEVTMAEFDENSGLWNFEVNNKEKLSANILFLALGPLRVLKFPKIPGTEDFKGHSFHSAQWDHEYSLKDKVVAVIGSGCSAAQFIPHVANEVKKLYSFVRSPKWLFPKDYFDRDYTEKEKWVLKHIPFAARFLRIWWYISMERLFPAVIKGSKLGEKMKGTLKRMMSWEISDKKLEEILIPTYPPFCSRAVLSPDYLSSLKRPNVEVVPTKIEKITEKGLQTVDGKVFEVDAIIYGTGFDMKNYLENLQVFGLQKQSLKSFWGDEPRGYKGLCVSGFPNLFVLLGINCGTVHNTALVMMEAQVGYAIKCVKKIIRSKLKYLDVKKPAMDDFYFHKIKEKAKNLVVSGDCRATYKDEHGTVFGLWPDWTFKYCIELRKPDFNDFNMVKFDLNKNKV